MPRARALCARALARARAHARNRSVYRFSANGKKTAKEWVRLWSVGLDGLQGLGEALILAGVAVSSGGRAWGVGGRLWGLTV